MKYASVIVPLVVVGVLFLIGCIWVATRGEKDDGDEESVLESPRQPMTKPELTLPLQAHTVNRTPPTMIPPLPIGDSSSHSGSIEVQPPRYER